MYFETIARVLSTYGSLFKALGIAFFGFFILKIIAHFVAKKIKNHLPMHIQVLLNKLIWYGGLLLLIFMVLSELGINITALIGAAGVVGVAIGFAAQTSVSNVISGLFLLIEHPFEIGDIIEASGLIGKIETVDLLSVRLKTPDGQLVRVPNEMLIKSAVINKTYYAERRITLTAVVKRNQDVMQVVALSKKVLESTDVVKKNPAISIAFKEIGIHMMELCIQCWVDSKSVVNSTASVIKSLHDAYAQSSLDVLIEVNQFQQSLIEVLAEQKK